MRSAPVLLFFNSSPPAKIYTLSLHDALPILHDGARPTAALIGVGDRRVIAVEDVDRSEEHTSELQSRQYLVCRLLLEKKKKRKVILHQFRDGLNIIHHLSSSNRTKLLQFILL